MIDRETCRLVRESAALAMRRVDLRIAIARETDLDRRAVYGAELGAVVVAHSAWLDLLRARLDG